LDIEAFEYRLLPHLLLSSPQTLCAVSLLVIEWHEKINARYEGKGDSLEWLLRQPECNMTVMRWH